jgi:hypothetical protein
MEQIASSEGVSTLTVMGKQIEKTVIQIQNFDGISSGMAHTQIALSEMDI